MTLDVPFDGEQEGSKLRSDLPGQPDLHELQEGPQ